MERDELLEHFDHRLRRRASLGAPEKLFRAPQVPHQVNWPVVAVDRRWRLRVVQVPHPARLRPLKLLEQLSVPAEVERLQAPGQIAELLARTRQSELHSRRFHLALERLDPGLLGALFFRAQPALHGPGSHDSPFKESFGLRPVLPVRLCVCSPTRSPASTSLRRLDPNRDAPDSPSKHVFNGRMACRGEPREPARPRCDQVISARGLNPSCSPFRETQGRLLPRAGLRLQGLSACPQVPGGAP